MYHGEEGNVKALHFVRRMRSETLKKMEEMETDDESKETTNTGSACE